MVRVFEGLGRLVVRLRWLVVAIWVAGAAVATATLPGLASRVNNDTSAFLPASAPSVRATELAAPLGLSTGVHEVLVVADRPGSPLGPADEAALAREVRAARRVKGVVRATEVALSPDGEAAELAVFARIGEASPTAARELVDGLEHTFGRIGAPKGLELHVAGQVATEVANENQSRRTGHEVQTLSVLFIIVLLLLVYRSVLAPVLTLLPAGLALALSSSLIGALASAGLKVSEVTQVLLIVLVLGAGTDYGLFLVFRVREELAEGRAPKEAVVAALGRVGESITASAGTVVFALLSLLLATFGMYHDLGVPLALGIGVMLLAGLTLLPALLAIAGRAAFWPSKARRGGARPEWWGRVAARVVRRPALALAAGGVVFGGLALGVLGYRAAGFGGSLSAPPGTDAAAGNAALARYFPKASANPTNLVLRYPTSVYTDPEVLVTAASSLQRSGEFRELVGPLDPNGTPLSPAQLSSLHARLGSPRRLPPTPPPGLAVSAAEYEAYRATAPLVGQGGHTVQFEASLVAGSPGSTAALHALPAIRAALARAARASGASASGVAGEAPALADVSSTSNRDLVHIVPLAALAIGVLLALVLRSLVAPLYLIASVVVSYLAALGVAVIVFVELGGSGGLTFLLPFLMFVFLLALGEDYNILVMTRIREEAARLPLREAVTKAVGRTGPTVTSAGLVLAGTFAVLAFSGGGGSAGAQIEDIGFGLAVGVLMDTFLVRTILVPSTVALLGRHNWWPRHPRDAAAAEPQREPAVASAPR